MTKTRRIRPIALFFAFALILIAFGCSPKKPVTDVEGNEVRIDARAIASVGVSDPDLIADEGFLLDEFDPKAIAVRIAYKGEEEEFVDIPLDLSMVMAEDKPLLRTPGTHTIRCAYKGFEFSFALRLRRAEIPKFAIDFYDDAGRNPIGTQIAKLGDAVAFPPAPAKDGYDAIGWRDRESGREYGLYDSIAVERNASFVAEYDRKFYDVEFYRMLGERQILIKKVSVPRGQDAYPYAPEIPLASGKRDGRWEDREAMRKVGKGNHRFRAVYSDDTVPVTFSYFRNVEGVFEDYSIEWKVDVETEGVTPPGDEARLERYAFLYWCVERNGIDVPVEFPYKVTGEMRFVARYASFDAGSEQFEYRPTEGGFEICGWRNGGATGVAAVPRTHERMPVVGIVDGCLADSDISEFRVAKDNETFRAVGGGMLADASSTALLVCPPRFGAERAEAPPGTARIAPSAFRNARNVREIALPESATEIGAGAFAGCAGLERIELPSGATEIADGLFEGCARLETVALSIETRKIGKGAFRGCAALRDMAFPTWLEELGEAAFAGCREYLPERADGARFEVDGGGAIAERLEGGKKALRFLPARADASELSAGIAVVEKGAISDFARGELIVESSEIRFVEGAATAPGLKCARFAASDARATIEPGAFDGAFPPRLRVSRGARINGVEATDESLGIISESLGGIEIGFESDAVSVADGYAYSTDSDGRAHIVGYAGDETDLSVPGRFGERIVVGIDENAFRSNRRVRSAALPDSVVSVGACAFEGCAALVEARFGAGLKEIGDDAFAGCDPRLTFVSGSASLERVGKNAFGDRAKNNAGETGLAEVAGCVVAYFGREKNVVVPPRVAIVCEEAFKGATFVSSIDFRDSAALRSVERGAFEGCEELVEIEFAPRGANEGGAGAHRAEIKDSAFKGCVRLARAKIGDETIETSSDGLTEFFAERGFDCAESAFEGCGTESGACFETNADGALTRYCGMGATCVVPAGVRAIGAEAFKDNCAIEEVVAPPELEAIGARAFAGCARLKSVVAPGLRSIGADAFEGTALLERHVDDCVIISGIFCKYLGSAERLHLPNSVRVICGGAFRGLKNPKYVRLPESLEEIGEEAFAGSAAREIDTPLRRSALREIGARAFADCKGLRTFCLNRCQRLEIIGREAFAGAATDVEPAGAPRLALPGSVRHIGESAFAGANARSATFEAGGLLAEIAEGAFENCAALESVAFAGASALREIRADAFANCSALRAFGAPSAKIERIGERAFAGTPELRKFEIDDSLLAEVGERAFESSRHISDSPDNATFVGSVLVRYSGNNARRVRVPEKTTAIGAGAFRGREFIAEADFRDAKRLKSIQSEAFAGCSGISGLEFPEGLEEIRADAFRGCVGLRRVSFDAALKALGTGAFGDCAALESVALPDRLETFGGGAFEGCENLKEITIANSDRYFSIDGVLYERDARTGEATLVAYPSGRKATDAGTEFAVPATIVANGAECRVTGVGERAFSGCSGAAVTKIALCAGLERIGEHAFAGIGAAVEFDADAPAKIEEFGECAFAEYAGTEIRIPETVKKIGRGAFMDCVNLSRVDVPDGVLEISGRAFDGIAAPVTFSPGSELKKLGEFAYAGYLGEAAQIPASAEEIGRCAFFGIRSRIVADGFEPTKIGERAFSGYAGSELPDIFRAATEIGSGAFSDLVGLSEDDAVFIPDSASVGARAFEGTRARIEFVSDESEARRPAKTRIPAYAYAGYLGGAFALIDEIEAIGNNAFFGCPNLRRIETGERCALKAVGRYAFAESGFEGFFGPDGRNAFPDSIEKIGRGAFENCVGLRSVMFGDGSALKDFASATEPAIEEDAFKGCRAISEMRLPFVGERFADAKHGFVGYLFGGASHSDNSEVAPPSLASVEVRFGALGEFAFAGCAGLRNFVAGPGATRIGAALLADCPRLETLTAPHGGALGYLFGVDGSAERVPESLRAARVVETREISDRAFANCEKLEEIWLSDATEKIGDEAFFGCSGLKSFRVGRNVSSIGRNAFGECVGLASIDASADNPRFMSDDGVLYGREPTEGGGERITLAAYPARRPGATYVIPHPVSEIAGYAFYQSELEELALPESVEEIGKFAFAYSAIDSFRLNAGILPASKSDHRLKIGDEAFKNNNFRKVYLDHSAIWRSETDEYGLFAEAGAVFARRSLLDMDVGSAEPFVRAKFVMAVAGLAPDGREIPVVARRFGGEYALFEKDPTDRAKFSISLDPDEAAGHVVFHNGAPYSGARSYASGIAVETGALRIGFAPAKGAGPKEGVAYFRARAVSALPGDGKYVDDSSTPLPDFPIGYLLRVGDGSDANPFEFAPAAGAPVEGAVYCVREFEPALPGDGRHRAPLPGFPNGYFFRRAGAAGAHEYVAASGRPAEGVAYFVSRFAPASEPFDGFPNGYYARVDEEGAHGFVPAPADLESPEPGVEYYVREFVPALAGDGLYRNPLPGFPNGYFESVDAFRPAAGAPAENSVYFVRDFAEFESAMPVATEFSSAGETPLPDFPNGYFAEDGDELVPVPSGAEPEPGAVYFRFPDFPCGYFAEDGDELVPVPSGAELDPSAAYFRFPDFPRGYFVKRASGEFAPVAGAIPSAGETYWTVRGHVRALPGNGRYADPLPGFPNGYFVREGDGSDENPFRRVAASGNPIEGAAYYVSEGFELVPALPGDGLYRNPLPGFPNGYFERRGASLLGWMRGSALYSCDTRFDWSSGGADATFAPLFFAPDSPGEDWAILDEGAANGSASVARFFLRRNGLDETILAFVGAGAPEFSPDAEYVGPDGAAARIADAARAVCLTEGIVCANEGAFSGFSRLRFAHLPDSATRICARAFENCIMLESLAVPDGVEEICAGAFAGCVGLKRVRLGSGVRKIGANAFKGCVGLTELELPAGLEEIGPGAFDGCVGLEKISVERGNARFAAFGGALYALSRGADAREARVFFVPQTAKGGFEVPRAIRVEGAEFSVVAVCANAFKGCAGISALAIPSGITDIDASAFEGCAFGIVAAHEASLGIFDGTADYAVAYPDWADAFCAGDCVIDRVTGALIAGCDESVIPSDGSAIEIAAGAFAGRAGLKAVRIPESVRRIDATAFAGCSGLTSISVDKDNPAFADAGRDCVIERATRALIVGCAATVIPSDPDLATRIGPGAFDGRAALKSVDIPDSIVEIGARAFADCGLERVELPESLKALRAGAFAGCAALKSAHVPLATETIERDAFEGCSAAIYCDASEKPANWRDCPLYCFRSEAQPTEAGCHWHFLPDGSRAFWPTVGLRYELSEDGESQSVAAGESVPAFVSIPAEHDGKPVLRIGSFAGLPGLVGAVAAEGLAAVEPGAFAGCSKLREIDVPDSVVEIGADAFMGTEWLDNMPDGPVYAGKVLLLFKGEMPEGYAQEIAEGTKGIAESALEGRIELESIVIPHSASHIGAHALKGCSGISDLDISSIRAIGEGAFDGCVGVRRLVASVGAASAVPKSALRRVELVSGEALPERMFDGLSGLESVVLPETLAEIERHAFRGCVGLEGLALPGAVMAIGENAFDGCRARIWSDAGAKADGWADCPLYCFRSDSAPSETGNYWHFLPDGRTRALWPTVGLGFELSADGTSYSVRAGESTPAFASIPAEHDGKPVARIADSAFEGVAGLVAVFAPDSVVEIGADAFKGTAWLDNMPDGPVYAGKVLHSFKGEMPEGYALEFAEGTKSIADCAFAGEFDAASCAWSGSPDLASVALPRSLTRIGAHAFAGCAGISDLDISSARAICEGAFDGCVGVRMLVAPAFAAPLVPKDALIEAVVISVGNEGETLPDGAFDGAAALERAELPYFLSAVGRAAFRGCVSLTEIAVPSTVSGIGESAFEGCAALERVEIGDSVVEIGRDAFKGTAWLDNMPDGPIYAGKALYSFKGEMPEGHALEIAEGTKGIADSALKDRSALESIVIPDSVSHIGENAFEGCAGLKRAKAPARHIGALPKSALESVEISSGAVIPAGAFRDCPRLMSVSVPSSVEAVESRAFENCPALESVSVPSSVVAVEADAFFACDPIVHSERGSKPQGWADSPLYCFYSQNAPLAIGNYWRYVDGAMELWPTVGLAYELSADRESYSVKAGETTPAFASIPAEREGKPVLRIGSFAGRAGLVRLIAPDGLVAVEAGAFDGCSKLREIDIPDSAVEIGRGAFAGTAWLDDMPDGPIYAGKVLYSFKGEMPEGYALAVADGTKGIAESALESRADLVSAVVPESVVRIGKSAFEGCSGLERIELSLIGSGDGRAEHFGHIFGASDSSENVDFTPESLKTVIVSCVAPILERAFFGCAGVQAAEIRGCAKICASAFEGCAALESVEIDDSVVEIGRDAFKGTAWLDNMPDGPVYAGKVLHSFKGEMSEGYALEIQDGTKGIADSALENRSELESIVIPNSVSHVGENAFEGVDGLKNATLPIWAAPRVPLSAAVSLTISAGEAIPERAFADHSALESVEICDSVVEIGRDAFKGTPWLANLPDGPVYAGKVLYSFKGEMPEEYALTVEEGTKGIADFAFAGEFDSESSVWPGSPNLASVVLAGSVVKVGKNAFLNCIGLKEIDLGAAECVDASAFEGCASLAKARLRACDAAFALPAETLSEVVLAGGNVPDEAFLGFARLREVVLSDVESIGARAFEGCVGLSAMHAPESVATIGEDAFDGCRAILYSDFESKPEGWADCPLYCFRSDRAPTEVGNFWHFGSDLETRSLWPTLGLSYSETFDGWRVSRGENPPPAAIVVPPTREGRPVTEVARAAFLNCEQVVAIELSDRTLRIGEGAFEGTAWLDARPEGFIRVGRALCGYNGEMPEGFSLRVPRGIKSIGDGAFAGRAEIASIKLPDGLTHIGANAFKGCSSLVSATVPEGVERIGKGAFEGCSGLARIELPFVGESRADKDNRFLGRAFGASEAKYNSLFVPESLAEVAVTSGEDIAARAFLGCSGISKVELSPSVVGLGENAFANCSSLTSINLDRVAEIGAHAFSGAIELEDLGPLDALARVGKNAFGDVKDESSKTKWLKNQPFGPAYVGRTLYGCVGDAPESVEAKPGTVSIADNAFAYSSSLKSASFPDSLAVIGRYAFAGCNGLSEIDCNKVSIIMASAFEDCSALKKVTLSPDISEVGEKAFFKCGKLANASVPISALRHIPSEKLRGVLTEITISGGADLPDEAFKGCSKLESITLPAGLRSIGARAFLGCSSLVSVTIPEGVERIGESAFEGCANLAALNAPDGVSSIGKDAFKNTAWFDNQPDAPVYVGKMLYADKSAGRSLALLADAIGIADGALSGQSNPETIIFPSAGLIYIGKDAFKGTAWLESQPSGPVYAGKVLYSFKGEMPERYALEIEEGTTGIADFAFAGEFDSESSAWSGSPNLASLALPDSLRSIGRYAFAGCSGLESADLKFASEIGACAFSDCLSLRKVVIGAAQARVAPDPFARCAKLAEATVHASAIPLLRGLGLRDLVVSGGASVPVGAFAGLESLQTVDIPIESGVAEIGVGAFDGTAWLDAQPAGPVYAGKVLLSFKGEMPENARIALEPGTIGIADSALAGRVGLAEALLPVSLRHVGSRAFADCVGLSAIHAPASVATIGEDAFCGCRAIVYSDFESKPDGWADCPLYCFYSATEPTEPGRRWHFLSDGTTRALWPTVGLEYELSADETSYSVKAGESMPAFASIPAERDGKPVARIADNAFENADSLRSVFLPKSLKRVGASAFAGRAGLREAIFDGPCEGLVIASRAFADCVGLSALVLPEGAETISADAFFGCSAVIYCPVASKPEGWADCPLYCFYSESEPTEPTEPGNYWHFLSDGTTRALWPTVGLEFELSEDGTSYSVKAGESTPAFVSIPAEHDGKPVARIADNAFENAASLRSAFLPESAEHIGRRAFAGCSSLASISFPSRISSLGLDAFDGTAWFDARPDGIVYAGPAAYAWKGPMPDGAELAIRADATCVAERAFAGRFELRALSVPAGTRVAPDSFAGCSGLTRVVCDAACAMLLPRDGLEEIYIVSGALPDFAFMNCVRLETVRLAKEVSDIGRDAFRNTKWFESLPDGLIYLGAALLGHKGEMPENSEISMLEGCVAVSDCAFENRSGLVSLVISHSVAQIGSRAFAGCANLASIRFRGTQEEWNGIIKGEGWRDGVPESTMVEFDG